MSQRLGGSVRKKAGIQKTGTGLALYVLHGSGSAQCLLPIDGAGLLIIENDLFRHNEESGARSSVSLRQVKLEPHFEVNTPRVVLGGLCHLTTYLPSEGGIEIEVH
jgi:hypothetical protein